MAEPKATEKVIPVVIEGLEINAPNVTFQRLQEFSLTLYERLLLQRSERNFLMLERDKLLAVLTNLRHEIQIAESAALNKEAELEQAQEKFRQDAKEVEQEVKYLEYDHKINLEQLKAWEGGLMARVDEENQKEMLELLEEKRRLKEEQAENEVKFEDQLMNLKKQQAQEIMDVEKENEESHIKKEMEFKRGLIDMKEEMTLRHEMEMSELEERKNCHLIELKNIHKQRLQDFKNFFNSVTAENLAVISCMRKSLEGISKTKVVMADEMDLLKKTNKKLQNPLEKSKAEVKDLARQLNNYQKDLSSLKNNKRMLKDTHGELNKKKNETDDALNLLNRNTDSVVSDFPDTSCLRSVIHFRNYAASRRRQLEESIEHMLKELEKKRKMLKNLSRDPEVRRAMCELNSEYWSPMQLNFELKTAKTAYDQALCTLEEKLIEFCVPESTLGHGPWRVHPAYIGPTGFVSKQ